MPEHTDTIAPAEHLTAGPLALTVDAGEGGRIVSFTWNGREVLTQKPVHSLCFGSTFWDAPQDAWNWPPRATLDSAPYTAAYEGKTLVLTSEVDAQSGLSFTKRFTANPARQRIEIVYIITYKKSAGAVEVGPWEITRVAGGTSFFPVGRSLPLPRSALPHAVDDTGILWYRFDAAELTKGRKLFSTGAEGWLAHRAHGSDLLFVKQFAPLTGNAFAAPGHGEIELWGQDGGIYVELENHGAYTRLGPGESVAYRVNWHLVPGVADASEAELLARARAIAAAHPLDD